MNNEFKQLKSGETPFLGGYVGEERYFGLPNKTFKVYLEGVLENGDAGNVPVQLITPKSRKMTRFILKSSKLKNLTDTNLENVDEDLIDELLDTIQDFYQIPEIVLENLTMKSLLKLIQFAVRISISPSIENKK